MELIAVILRQKTVVSDKVLDPDTHKCEASARDQKPLKNAVPRSRFGF